MTKSHQRSFADINWDRKKKETRRERFLREMAGVVPWSELAQVSVSRMRPQ